MMKHSFFVRQNIVFVLLFTIAACAVLLPSCASRKIRKSGEAGIAPPPPPPPPPPATPSPASDEEIPFVVVEEMPMFPGGDSMLIDFIIKNTVYPQEAKDKGVEGRVITRFCIRPDGGVDKVTVLRGVSPELDKEAIRVMSSLPKFIPGKQGGKAVPVWYMAPVTFTLGGK